MLVKRKKSNTFLGMGVELKLFQNDFFRFYIFAFVAGFIFYNYTKRKITVVGFKILKNIARPVFPIRKVGFQLKLGFVGETKVHKAERQRIGCQYKVIFIKPFRNKPHGILQITFFVPYSCLK